MMIAASNLPPEILTTETLDGVNYMLPRPTFGFLRRAGLKLSKSEVERGADPRRRAIAERIQQPVESTAVFERHDHGLSITIAPLGMRGADEGGLHSLIGFAVFFFDHRFVAVPVADWAHVRR